MGSVARMSAAKSGIYAAWRNRPAFRFAHAGYEITPSARTTSRRRPARRRRRWRRAGTRRARAGDGGVMQVDDDAGAFSVIDARLAHRIAQPPLRLAADLRLGIPMFAAPHGGNLASTGRKARSCGSRHRDYFAHRRSSYTQRPPSTSSTLPVRNEASSEARNKVALATWSMVAKRPSGTVALNCARSSGESPPMKVGNNGVSAITGAIAQTRMPSPASSTAIDLDTRFTAALEALYHVSPGRGLSRRSSRY